MSRIEKTWQMGLDFLETRVSSFYRGPSAHAGEFFHRAAGKQCEQALVLILRAKIDDFLLEQIPQF